MSVEPRILRWHRRRHPLLRTAHPLTRRSIYILPTRTGLVFTAVLLAMLGWSINYNASLGFALVFLLGTIALEAMRRTHDNLLGLTVHPPLAEPVFAGDTAFIRLRLEAPAGEIRYGVVVRTAAGVETGGDLDGPLAALDLPVPAQRRGRLASGALRVSTCFPLGLFTAWTWVEFQPSGLVWPQPAGVAQLPAGSCATPAGCGQTSPEGWNSTQVQAVNSPSGKQVDTRSAPLASRPRRCAGTGRSSAASGPSRSPPVSTPAAVRTTTP
ncbi:MAG TPA: hypothetical protein PKW88_00360 [Plasticicumulans sp.]|nr:hypothetical protein [Plasticicumulans sp.]